MLLVLFQILRSKRDWAALFLIWILFSSPTALWAQTNPSNPPDPALSSPDKSQSEPSTLGKVEDSWTFFPAGTLFSPLLADPREPSIGMVSYASEKGFEGSLGGTLEALRWKSAPDMEWGWGIFTGIWTLSDSPDLADLRVSDWYSGTYLSEKTGPFSLRFDLENQASNLGDANYMNPSVGFNRELFKLTISLNVLPDLRVYMGGGCKWPFEDYINYETQVLFFSGLEATSAPFSLLGSPCRGYLAYHFRYQDQAGGTYNHTVQCGLRMNLDQAQSGSLRLALIYDGGHSEFGDFFQQYDQHWGIGIFYDP